MVLTPKQWWHHCSQNNHKHVLSDSKTDTLDENCPVCDLSLSVFTSPTALVFHVFKQIPYVHGSTICLGLTQTQILLFQLRAPPYTMI